MTCKRCEDIHEAQKNGKSTVPCKCDCHNESWTLVNPTWTGTDAHIDYSSTFPTSTFIDTNSISTSGNTLTFNSDFMPQSQVDEINEELKSDDSYVWLFDKPKKTHDDNCECTVHKKRGVFHSPEDGFCDCSDHVEKEDIVFCGCPRPCYCNIVHSKECVRNAYKELNRKDK